MRKETNRIEFKQQLTEDLEKESAAFLNYPKGGIMYIGINKEGNVVDIWSYATLLSVYKKVYA